MTPEKVKSVFAYYRSALDEGYPSIVPVRFDEEDSMMSAKDLGWPRLAAHYKFMCDEGQRLVDAGRIEKAMRWLGFLQGALWRQWRFTLDQLKNHSRPEPPTCYKCVHCREVDSSHVCQAPTPAWTQGEANDNIPIIEDAAHDATMAAHCELFQPYNSGMKNA
jgi:hypothetical protein